MMKSTDKVALSENFRAEELKDGSLFDRLV